MAPPPRGMTKNQDRTHRYRPGKPAAEAAESEDSSDDDRPPPTAQPVAARPRQTPAATTFPTHRKLPPAPIARKPEIDLEGFVTASESSSEEGEEDDDENSDSDDDQESSEEESESEEEVKPRLIAPKFMSKAQRAAQNTASQQPVTVDKEERVLEILKAQVEVQAVRQKDWDDDNSGDEVDDTDGKDPEAEHAAWKLRELKRLARTREQVIQREKELEETERRKGLSAAELELENRSEEKTDKAYDQDEDKSMQYMQRYHHKGAFFQGEEQDEEVAAALARNTHGARFVDDYDKTALPEYLKVRDMTQIGRRSRTKYKDMRSEDTGEWAGDNAHDRKRARYT